VVACTLDAFARMFIALADIDQNGAFAHQRSGALRGNVGHRGHGRFPCLVLRYLNVAITHRGNRCPSAAR
jgi:hypothetical protein